MAHKTVDLSKEKLDAIVQRLQARTSKVKDESRALGFKNNGPLRTALCAHIGRDAYFALLGAKAARISTYVHTPRPRPSDEGLPLVKTTSRKDGWDWRYVHEHEAVPVSVDLPHGKYKAMDTGARILVLRSPDGTEYTEAFSHEKADLLRVNPVDESYPPSRFVAWEKSERRKQVEKHMRQDEKLHEHIAAQKTKEVVTTLPTPPVKTKRAKAVTLDLKKPADAALVKAALKAGVVKAEAPKSRVAERGKKVVAQAKAKQDIRAHHARTSAPKKAKRGKAK